MASAAVAAAAGPEAVDVDVVVIGGGCNGTGLARDLSKRGLRVALYEKADLGRGATGNSSAMIHGGPRYLLNDTQTTRHACIDSGHIQKIVPHLLFRIPFVVPVPRVNPFGRLGLLLHDAYFDVYDRYAPFKGGIPHAQLSPAQLAAVEPGLVGDYLGAITLDEWGIDPGRLCVLNARDAAAHGASIHTYTPVTGLLRAGGGAIMGVTVCPQGGVPQAVRARAVVNCAGPWAQQVGSMADDRVRLRPGKGVHLIYGRRLTNYAVTTQAVDGRQIFIMPYQNETWIGTTDDDFYGDLDAPEATADEVGYLRTALERLFPRLVDQRLIGTRVGIRNTIDGWGVPEDDLSRRHEIVDHGRSGAAGLFSILGGKLASFRMQAAEAADAVCVYLGRPGARCETHLHTLPGGSQAPTPEALMAAYPIDLLSAQRLLYRHGALAPAVLELGRESADGYAIVDPLEPVLACEVRWCLRHEYVRHLGDLSMRCRVASGSDLGLAAGRRVATIFAEERGLDRTDAAAGLADLLGRRWRTARAVLSNAQLAQAELLRLAYRDLLRAPERRHV